MLPTHIQYTILLETVNERARMLLFFFFSKWCMAVDWQFGTLNMGINYRMLNILIRSRFVIYVREGRSETNYWIMKRPFCVLHPLQAGLCVSVRVSVNMWLPYTADVSFYLFINSWIHSFTSWAAVTQAGLWLDSIRWSFWGKRGNSYNSSF